LCITCKPWVIHSSNNNSYTMIHMTQESKNDNSSHSSWPKYKDTM
jgi:hypothetical protein